PGLADRREGTERVEVPDEVLPPRPGAHHRHAHAGPSRLARATVQNGLRGLVRSRRGASAVWVRFQGSERSAATRYAPRLIPSARAAGSQRSQTRSPRISPAVAVKSPPTGSSASIVKPASKRSALRP